MKNITKILALVMVLTMVFCMAACTTGEPEGTTEASSTNETTRPTIGETEPSSEPDDGKMTYTITVKDSEGNPQAGIMVQVCLELCVPGVTDENGVATFRLEEASGYSAGVGTVNGVSYYDQTKIYYEDGKYDVTIVWDAPEAE